MVTRSPIDSKKRASKEFKRQRSPQKGATLLPSIDNRDNRMSSQSLGQESSFRPPSNEAELAAQLDDALNALDDLGDVPVPAAANAARDESVESELF